MPSFIFLNERWMQFVRHSSLNSVSKIEQVIKISFFVEIRFKTGCNIHVARLFNFFLGSSQHECTIVIRRMAKKTHQLIDDGSTDIVTSSLP